MQLFESIKASVKVILADIGQGFFLITHSGLALLGLAVFCFFLIFSTQTDLRDNVEVQLIDWLQNRHGLDFGFNDDADAVDRATATDPRDLTKEQAAIAFWLSRKYRVAPEPLSAIVSDVFDVAPKNQVDPWLVIAVIAVDSNFNPFFQGPSGKLGLMQYQPEQASSRTSAYGGAMASFDPLSNVRMGLAVLKDSLLMAGTVREGLKLYSGEYAPGEDDLYVNKVLAEYQRLVQASTLAKQVPEPVTPYLQESVAQGVESWGEQTWRALMEWLHLIQTATPPESGS